MRNQNERNRKRPVREQEPDTEIVEGVDEAENDEEAKVYKRRELMNRFKLGSHYRMERFSIMFGFFTVFLMVFSLFGFTNYKSAQREQLSTRAKYTSTFEFSLSKQSGAIDNIYRDPDGKRAYVLFKMNNVSNLSVDAKNYELFLTGFNKKLKQEPESSLFIFGSSGYMGIELYDERGLSNEIMEFTLRANSTLYENQNDLTEEQLAEMADASFAKHDQAQFYANVGAEDAVVMDVLDKQLEPVELYYALIGRHDEDVIFDRIDKHTTELARLLALHNEYSNRLVELGYQAPKTPVFMDGDYVDEDGVFHPRTNVLGYHKLDYNGKRVTDGFVLQVVDSVADFRSYMATKRAENQQAQSSSAAESEKLERVETLIRNDGYVLPISEISSGESTSNETSALEAVKSLEATWSSYLSEKRALQITAMRDLLLLDADIRTQGNAFSSHSGDDFVTFW